MFVHENLDTLPDLPAKAREGIGRIYTTPEGNEYPSVTTVLGLTSDMSWLQEWRDRVGEKEADKILRQAGRRGTAVHEICEEYLKNNPKYIKGHMPANIASFKYIKPYLDENITSIGGLELPLYSDKLRTAGRVDCLCKWKGKWAVLDFKTSRRNKDRNDVHGYFMQASAYSYMIYERLGIIASSLVIVMTIDDAPAKVFEERAKDWLPKFIEKRNSLVDI